MDDLDLPVWIMEMAAETSNEERRRRICRAAAEICGLTAGMAMKLATQIDQDYWGTSVGTISALRRFAALAQEEPQNV